jgi:hypothetical protein
MDFNRGTVGAEAAALKGHLAPPGVAKLTHGGRAIS